MAKRNTRSKIHICNVIIAILCLVAIITYFLFPFWKVKLSYTLDAQAVESMLSEVSSDSSDEETDENSGGGTDEDTESAEGDDEQDVEDKADQLAADTLDIDLAEVLGEDGITLELGITVQTTDVFGALFNSDEAEVVRKILESNIDSMVDQLLNPINQLVKGATKSLSKVAIRNAVFDHVKQLPSYSNKTDEEVQELMNNAGVTDAYLDNEVEKIMTKMEQGVAVDVVSGDVINSVNGVLQKLSLQDPEIPSKLSNEADVRKQVEDSLKKFATSDGQMNMDELVADIILNAMGSESEDSTTDESTDGGEDAAAQNKPLNASYMESESSDESNKTYQLKAELKSKIMDELPADVANTIVTVLRYVCYVLFFTFFTWIYIIIKILAKINAKNNAVRLGVPIWLGCLPPLILCVIPTVGMLVAKKVIAQSFAGSMDAAAIENLSLSFFSAGIVSYFIGVFFVFFVLFYYGRLRRRMKNISKGILSEHDSSAVAQAELQKQAKLREAAMSDNAYVQAVGEEYFEEDFNNDNSYE